MRFSILTIFFLMLLTSCASKKQDVQRIQDRIAAEQVRTLTEIQRHSEMILEAHPELSNDAKLQVKAYMAKTLEKQQLLKDEECKIVQILLSKSLRTNQLTSIELKDKKGLKKRLKLIYELKADNIFSLVSHITEMSEKNEVNEGFEADMQLLIRDFR